MGVDPAQAQACEVLLIHQRQGLPMIGLPSLGEGFQQAQLFPVAEVAAGQLPDDEGVHQNLLRPQKRLQPGIAFPQVSDPDGGIHQSHATRSVRLLGIGPRPGSVLPNWASRRALSRAIRACSPRWTRAVFSFSPVG